MKLILKQISTVGYTYVNVQEMDRSIYSPKVLKCYPKHFKVKLNAQAVSLVQVSYYSDFTGDYTFRIKSGITNPKDSSGIIIGITNTFVDKAYPRLKGGWHPVFLRITEPFKRL